jgi:hypothetical protein
MLSFTLQKNAQVPLTANVIDQLGSPAHAAAAVNWAVADEAIATLDQNSGDTVVLTAHEEGVTAVTLAVGSLTTILHLTVAAAVPSSVSIEIGTPVAKPEAAVEHAAQVPVAETVAHVDAAAEPVAEVAPVEPAPSVEAAAPATPIAEAAAPIESAPIPTVVPAPEAAHAAA